MTMVSNYWRIVSLPVLLTALGSPLLIDCGKLPSVPGAPNIPGAPGNCPDMANVDAVANFDWQKEFKLDAAAAGKLKLMLPRDHVCAKELVPNAFATVFPDEIPGGWMGLDIGPQTITQFTGVLKAAKTIVWSGPMGVFETRPCEVGTRDVAMAIAKATAGGAVSIIGGGDSAAAVEAFGIVDRFTHVSTGGGASLQMLEGTPFDSLAVLDDA